MSLKPGEEILDKKYIVAMEGAIYTKENSGCGQRVTI